MQCDTTILTTHGGAVSVVGASRVRIAVSVDDVANLAVGPTAGAAYERSLAIARG